jgi:hypothetical protein
MPYRNEMIYDKYGMRTQRERTPRTSFGKRFLFPNQTNDQSTHPYNYSPFVHWSEPGFEKDPAEYDDRMQQWDRDKWEEARRTLPSGRFEHQTSDALSVFLSAYWGKKMRCTALVEGCNVSNGYPYFVFYHRDVK